MRRRISRIILALIAVGIIALSLSAWIPIRQAMNLQALKNIVPDAKVGFLGADKVALLPERLSPELGNWLQKNMGYERYQLCFGGPIERIALDGVAAPNSAVARALARFPDLKKVEITSKESARSTGVDWTGFCQALRSCRGLEDLAINRSMLTDAAIVPLTGHPTLKSFSIGGSQFTPAFISTLATMPRLERLQIYYSRKGASYHFTEEQWKQIFADLHSLPRLQHIAMLIGPITDDSLAPLARHPSIRMIEIDAAYLSEKSLPVFASMPSLTRLVLLGGWRGEKGASVEMRKALSTALPSVMIQFAR